MSADSSPSRALSATILGAAMALSVGDGIAGLLFWSSAAEGTPPPLAPQAATAAATAVVLALLAGAMRPTGLRALPMLQGAALAGAGLLWVGQREVLRSRWFDVERLVLPIAGALAVGALAWWVSARLSPHRLERLAERGWIALAALAALALGALLLAHTDGYGGGFWLLGGTAALALGWRAPGLALPAALVGHLLLAAAVAAERAPATPPPNPAGSRSPARIVLIVVDTLRADALSCYRPDARPTPAIDALAADGVLFETARSATAWTLPSMCSLLTGTSPLVHLARSRESILPPAIPTLAEGLQSAGYRTAAIGQNPFLKRRSGLDRGFEHFALYPRDLFGAPVGGKLLRVLWPDQFDAFVTDATLTDEALAWIDSARERDFFLWLHLFDPHAPYSPALDDLPGGRVPDGLPREVDSEDGQMIDGERERQWVRTLYAAEVQSTDRAVGRLLEGMRAAGLYDDALIVLTSDHGEEFWEHGGFEHGHSFYDEVLRVPLIVKPPGGGGGERRVEPVNNSALAATLLSAAGVEYPTALVPALDVAGALASSEGEHEWPLTGLIYGEPREGVLRGGLKYWREERTGTESAFDLTVDPFELDSLGSDGRTAALVELSRELRAAAAATRDGLGVDAAELADHDSVAIDQLRALGYTD